MNSVSEIINNLISKNKQKTFFIDSRLGPLYSYKDLSILAKKFLNKIGSNSKKKSDIALLLKNQSSYLPVLISSWSAFKTPSILDPNINCAKLKDIYNKLNFEFIVTDFPDFNPTHLKIPTIYFNLNELLSNSFTKKPLELNINYSPNEAFIILFTSGSTGIPKFVPLSIKNILSNISAFYEKLPITIDDVFFCTSPPFYAHGLYNSLLTSFFTETKILSCEPLNTFNAMLALNKAIEYNASIYHLTPSMIRILNTIVLKIKHKLPSFKYVICGTSRLDKKDKTLFERNFNVSVTQQYGMTETLFMTVNHDAQLKYPESVGQPVGCKLRISINNNLTDDPNVTGEILCKSQSMFGSYYKQPDETENSYQNGWFKTGDIGHFNKYGYLFVTGRCKEMIKKAGYNINPNEIDQIIASSKKVKICKTIGIPSKMYGEDIVTCIIRSDNSLSKHEVLQLCRKELPPHYIPSQIVFLKDFPYTATGKIDTTKLQEYILKNPYKQ